MDPTTVQKPDGSWIRRLMLVCITCGAVWLIYSEFRRMQSRGLREIAEAPDRNIPEYDCLKEVDSQRVRNDRGALRDVTDEWKIDFHHEVGPPGTWFMPESIGAGAAVLDYDMDGLMDLYFVNCGRSPETLLDFAPGTRTENKLFRQTELGVFEDVTDRSGLGDRGYGAGVAVGDLDNDGFPDVFIANYAQDSLYRNTGNGSFENVTDSLGRVESDWGVAAVFFDYDRDGWLDILVVNYTEDPLYNHSVSCGFQHGLVSYCGPHKFQPTVDRLYHNETGLADPHKRTLRFRDVTEESGLGSAKTFGFSAICADLTNDGWPDVFVANDGAANRLWVNHQDGTFSEEAQQRGIAVNEIGAMEAGMGVALGDINFDLHPDIVVSHLSGETTTLYIADGAGGFVDRTSGSGLDLSSRNHTGWGAALVDLDHDGLLDMPLVNGLVVPCHSGFPFHGEDQFQERHEPIKDLAKYWEAYVDENKLLMGSRNIQFREDQTLGGDFTASFGSGRGLVTGDIDNDGDFDLVVTNCGGNVRCYRNDFQKSGHWLMVKLETGDARRDALGAKVVISLPEGHKLGGFCVPQTSYLASNDPRMHFGLGSVKQIENIIVEWPDGPVELATEQFPGGDVDQIRVLKRGRGHSIGRQPGDRAVDR